MRLVDLRRLCDEGTLEVYDCPEDDNVVKELFILGNKIVAICDSRVERTGNLATVAEVARLFRGNKFKLFEKNITVTQGEDKVDGVVRSVVIDFSKCSDLEYLERCYFNTVVDKLNVIYGGLQVWVSTVSMKWNEYSPAVRLV